MKIVWVRLDFGLHLVFVSEIVGHALKKSRPFFVLDCGGIK